MKTLRNLTGKVLFTAGLLMVVGLLAVRAQEKITDLQIGDAAPDFELLGIDGKTYSLADFADGKLLMVFFTSNHCPTSHGVEERLLAFLDETDKKDLSFVAINPNHPDGLSIDELSFGIYNDGYEDMIRYAADRGFTFPYLYDGETQDVARAYGCLATPHVFIFDEQRKLRYKGRFDDSMYADASTVKSPDAQNAVQALLTGGEVPVAVTQPMGCSTKWRSKKAGILERMAQWDKTPVDVAPIDTDQVAAVRANGSNNFRLINVWATWCVPCVDEFPILVSAARRFDWRNFDFITISVDHKDQKDAVKAFLEGEGAGLSDPGRKRVLEDGRTTNSYLFTGGNADELMKTLDDQWQGGVPYTVLVNPQGEVVWRNHGVVEEEEMLRQIVNVIGAHYVP